MSRDPYIDVKRELEANLSSTHSLLTSYDRIASSSTSFSSPAVLEARDELRGTLSLLEADLEDLEESVRVVEETGERWGIEEDEVRRRRGFVERVKGEVQALRGRVFRNEDSPRRGKGKAPFKYRDIPDVERGEADDAEEVKRWEMEEQQTMMRQQDDTLGVISGTLSTLASQAGLIGHEVNEQSEMLDDLGTHVDSTDTRLRKVSRTMQDFIRRNEETKSGWCICILIFVLIVLLVAVILT